MVTPERRGQRAVAVRALLADANIQDAFKSIESDLTAEWRKAHCPIERENLWRALNIMDRLKSWMASAASHDLTALRRSGK